MRKKFRSCTHQKRRVWIEGMDAHAQTGHGIIQIEGNLAVCVSQHFTWKYTSSKSSTFGCSNNFDLKCTIFFFALETRKNTDGWRVSGSRNLKERVILSTVSLILRTSGPTIVLNRQDKSQCGRSERSSTSDWESVWQKRGARLSGRECESDEGASRRMSRLSGEGTRPS